MITLIILLVLMGLFAFVGIFTGCILFAIVADAAIGILLLVLLGTGIARLF